VILTDVPYRIDEPCTPLACALPPRDQKA